MLQCSQPSPMPRWPSSQMDFRSNEADRTAGWN
jgi:hypothetical protein